LNFDKVIVDKNLNWDKHEEFLRKYLPLKKMLSSEPIVVVLHGHLITEHYLDEYIVINKLKGDIALFDLLRLEFVKKSELVKDNFPENIKTSLTLINKIRRDFAHDLDAKIDLKRIQQLVNVQRTQGLLENIEDEKFEKLPKEIQNNVFFGMSCLCTAAYIAGLIDEVETGRRPTGKS